MILFGIHVSYFTDVGASADGCFAPTGDIEA
jgi:hypothetical protein